MMTLSSSTKHVHLPVTATLNDVNLHIVPAMRHSNVYKTKTNICSKLCFRCACLFIETWLMLYALRYVVKQPLTSILSPSKWKYFHSLCENANDLHL